MYPKKLKKCAWGNMIDTTTAANIAASGINTALPQNQYQDPISPVDKNREEWAKIQKGASYVPVYGQAVAAFGTIGSTIGKQTQVSKPDDPNYGLYKSKAAQIADNAVNPVTGYGNVKNIVTGKIPMFANKFSWKNGIFNSNFNNVATGGLAGKSYTQEQQELANIGKRQAYAASLEKNSQEFLKSYPTYGDMETAKYGMRIPKFGRTPNFFRGLKTMAYGGYSKKWNPSEYPTNWAQGGELPQVTDNSDQKQIASDMNIYKGATHAQGGIDLDTNKDGKPDIEVENNEVIKDDMVLSDRMIPSDVLKEHLRQLGIYKQEGDTFASYAERLGKKKGEWEMKLNSHLLGEANTAKRMVSKFDNAVDMLFQDQQSQKPVEKTKTKYPTGGELPTGWEFVDEKPSTRQGYKTKSFINRGALPEPNYTGQVTREDFIKNTGAFNRKDLDFPLNQAVIAFQSNPNVQSVTLGREKQSVEGMVNPSYPLTSRTEEYRDLDYGVGPHTFNMKGVSPFTSTSIPSFRNPDNTIVPRTNLFSQDNKDLAKLNNMKLPKRGQSYVSTYSYGGSLRDRIKKSFPNGGTWKDYLNDNVGDLATLAGTVGNQIAIGKLKTDYQPELAPVPTNTYTDRSDYITNQNQAQFRALTYGLNSGSQQDNQGLRSNMYAKTLGSANEQLDRETQRKDAYQQHYQQMLQYNNFFNTQQKNYGKQLTMDNKNQKVALTQANLNNSIQSIIGNRTQKDARGLDFMKAKLYASMGEKGVADRTMGISTDEELRKYYGMNREEIKALRKRLTNIGNVKQTKEIDTSNYILDSQP